MKPNHCLFGLRWQLKKTYNQWGIGGNMADNVISIKDALGRFDATRGVYVLHNGVEFVTLAEVKAFIIGLEYAKGNANIGMDTVIENSLESLKDMEIN